ncbi:zinc metalloproteinase nas-4-like protein, partial [Dinothrombium tinctorium]
MYQSLELHSNLEVYDHNIHSRGYATYMWSYALTLVLPEMVARLPMENGRILIPYLFIGSEGCDKRDKIDFLHETLHAIGFTHEMSRPDAHKYITVHWDNIAEKNKRNFQQMKDDWLEKSGFNYSAMFPYDKHSVLHYTTYQQAKDNSRPTITLKSGGTITKATSLSEIDIKELRYFYNCTAIDKSFEKRRKISPINPPPHYCYNASESSDMFCVLDSEALFAQSFSEQDATKLTTQAFTADLWHLNYGRTPSTYNENDSYTNFYLHLGE